MIFAVSTNLNFLSATVTFRVVFTVHFAAVSALNSVSGDGAVRGT